MAMYKGVKPVQAAVHQSQARRAVPSQASLEVVYNGLTDHGAQGASGLSLLVPISMTCAQNTLKWLYDNGFVTNRVVKLKNNNGNMKPYAIKVDNLDEWLLKAEHI